MKVLEEASTKATWVAPMKPDPVMDTEAVPAVPEEGESPVMVGVTEKLPLDVAVPPGVVTLMTPLLAADGIVAVIWVPLSTLNTLIARL